MRFPRFVLFDVVICASHRSFFPFFGSILIILCFVYCAAFALVQSFSIILWFQLKSFLVIFLLWMLNLQVAILVIQRLIDGMEIRTRTMILTELKLLFRRMFLLGKFRKISHGWVLLGIANNVWSTTNLSAVGESPSRYAHSLLIFMIFLLSLEYVTSALCSSSSITITLLTFPESQT